MADATSTDSGSPERVAYDLMVRISNKEGEYYTKDAILDLYAECLKATSGKRNPEPHNGTI